MPWEIAGGLKWPVPGRVKAAPARHGLVHYIGKELGEQPLPATMGISVPGTFT